VATTVYPFLMFQGGNAEPALNFYVSLIPDSAIVEIVRHTATSGGTEGTVMKATFRVGNQTVLCTDSAIQHAFTFTPAFSFFVNCESEPQLARLFSTLSDRGAVLMPLDNYGFSKQFAWVNDRFGVSWQLNLP
jgi:predicted 3-demethylubiquinone-9 3-methyltransferase (glyoxalase superfamily)